MKDKTITWYMKQSRKIASLLALHRDNYTCLKCGKKREGGWKIDASHIKPKGTYRSMSADVDNIKALCFMCHKWWHSDVTESGIWFKKQYPDWDKKLRLRAMKPTPMGKFEWQKKWEKLTEEFNNIINA